MVFYTQPLLRVFFRAIKMLMHQLLCMLRLVVELAALTSVFTDMHAFSDRSAGSIVSGLKRLNVRTLF